MSDDAAVDSLIQDGRMDLGAYRKFGGGIDLFRAYINRRRADQLKTQARRKKQQLKLRGGPSFRAYKMVLDELTMLDILDDLDPIISDLLRFCEDSGTQEKQLRKLRRALRIDRGKSPSDVKLQKQREAAIRHWVGAYLAMNNGGPFQSKHKIAKEIAAELRISWRAALNYWEDFAHKEPWNGAWADEISNRAKGAARSSKVKRSPIPHKT